MTSKSGKIQEISYKPHKLSRDQRRAVFSQARYNGVVAGAEAGKTETLTRRIVYLLLVKKIKTSSIVAFTFTEKAAQSMKSRIYQRVEEISGPGATSNLGEMYVGTIHACTERILRITSALAIMGSLMTTKKWRF